MLAGANAPHSHDAANRAHPLLIVPQAVWKDVSKHRRVAIFSVFAAAFLASSAFGGLGTFTNVREHNGRVSITIGAPHEVRHPHFVIAFERLSLSAFVGLHGLQWVCFETGSHQHGQSPS